MEKGTTLQVLCAGCACGREVMCSKEISNSEQISQVKQVKLVVLAWAILGGSEDR